VRRRKPRTALLSTMRRRRRALPRGWARARCVVRTQHAHSLPRSPTAGSLEAECANSLPLPQQEQRNKKKKKQRTFLWYARAAAPAAAARTLQEADEEEADRSADAARAARRASIFCFGFVCVCVWRHGSADEGMRQWPARARAVGVFSRLFFFVPSFRSGPTHAWMLPRPLTRVPLTTEDREDVRDGVVWWMVEAARSFSQPNAHRPNKKKHDRSSKPSSGSAPPPPPPPPPPPQRLAQPRCSRSPTRTRPRSRRRASNR
jgi:hypothetical protein